MDQPSPLRGAPSNFSAVKNEARCQLPFEPFDHLLARRVERDDLDHARL